MKADTNYIYIILVMVYIIYNIIKAGKKAAKNRPVVVAKNPQQTDTDMPANPKNPQPTAEEEFKKIMEQMLGKLPEMPKKQIHQPKHQQAKITHALPIEKILPQKTKHLSDRQNAPMQQSLVLQEQKPIIDFDLRQAIIFSEILKKPW